MLKISLVATALLAVCPAFVAWADDAPPPPPPPPKDVWIGKGQFGFLDSQGNSDARSVNGNLDMTRYDGNWKNEFIISGLYGKSAGIVSAERYDWNSQSNYNFTDDFFGFIGTRYEHDMFDGFQYQASITTGVGYKLINTDSTKLNAQIGAGYRKLRPEDIIKDADGVVIDRILEDSSSEAIGTVGSDFSHAFNASTSITNKFLAEIGADNTLVTDQIALSVKMSSALSLVVGYGASYNTAPPGNLKKLDTVTTINLAFAF